jgi:hypothetical protein
MYKLYYWNHIFLEYKWSNVTWAMKVETHYVLNKQLLTLGKKVFIDIKWNWKETYYISCKKLNNFL